MSWNRLREQQLLYGCLPFWLSAVQIPGPLFFHVWLQRETFWAVVFINCLLFKLCWTICGPGLWTSLVSLLAVSTLVHQTVLKTYGADTWLSRMWFLLGWRLLLRPTLFIYFSRETRNKFHTCYQWISIYFRIFTAILLSFFFEERNSSWLLMLFYCLSLAYMYVEI